MLVADVLLLEAAGLGAPMRTHRAPLPALQTQWSSCSCSAGARPLSAALSSAQEPSVSTTASRRRLDA